MIGRRQTNLSWLGLADMFLFFFLLFLAAYIMAADNDISTGKDKNIKQLNIKQLIEKIKVLEREKEELKNVVQTQDEKIKELIEKIKALEQENQAGKNTTQTQDEKIKELIEKIKALEQEIKELKKLLKPSQSIGDTFGRIITEALTILNDLKTKMEGRDFPVKIYRYPDSLFFDMQIFFKFGHNEIINTKYRESIKIIGNQFRHILDQKHSFVCNNTTVTCELNEIMRIVIEGHTDDKKKDEMANFHYSSNRALEVLQIFIKECGMLPPKYKMSTAGYAEFGRQPLVEEWERNNIDVYRDRMRRVTISIVPNYEGLPKELKDCLNESNLLKHNN